MDNNTKSVDMVQYIDKSAIEDEKLNSDIEVEIEKFLDETGYPYCWCNDDEQKEWCAVIAKHFYELGRKANN